MAYIGQQPPAVALTASDITDGIISTDKLANLAVSTAKITDDAVGNTKLDLTANYAFTGTITGAGGGKVLQVVQTESKTNFSTTSNTFTDLTPITVDITPSATTSKVLVLCNLNFGGSADNRTGVRLIRAGTYIFGGDDQGNRQGVTTATEAAEDNSIYNVAFQFLDTPNTTSATTYKIQVSAQTSGSETVYLNQTGSDANQQYTKNTSSSITCIEIGA